MFVGQMKHWGIGASATVFSMATADWWKVHVTMETTLVDAPTVTGGDPIRRGEVA